MGHYGLKWLKSQCMATTKQHLPQYWFNTNPEIWNDNDAVEPCSNTDVTHKKLSVRYEVCYGKSVYDVYPELITFLCYITYKMTITRARYTSDYELGKTLHTPTSWQNGQNGCHVADNIFRCIFVNEKFSILINILMKFVPKGLIDNNPALVQVMAWRWTGDKPLPEAMLT